MASLRLAEEQDIPAIVALLLTSFRQFPLFDILYSPLNKDLDNAKDTIFFWSRRLFLDVHSPSATVVLAELPSGSPTTLSSPEGAEGVEKRSWDMLDWATRNGRLSQISRASRNVIVGFAIWKKKGQMEQAQTALQISALTKLRQFAINFELWFYGKFYNRQDQDTARYQSYLKSEDELQQRFYINACYNLDNLCVDFRYHRLGIGTLLVRWGVERALSEGLPVGTEASQKGVGLYKKLGFKEIGMWNIHFPNDEQDIEIPVMWLSAASVVDDRVGSKPGRVPVSPTF